MNDTIREARLDDLHDRMVEAMPYECECGESDWKCVFSDRYHGANLDGRFGVMLRTWECPCGNKVDVVG